MKPKLIDSKKIFKVIKVQRNLQNSIIKKQRHLYSNIFIFLFIIFIIFVVYTFYIDKNPIQKIKNKKLKK